MARAFLLRAAAAGLYGGPLAAKLVASEERLAGARSAEEPAEEEDEEEEPGLEAAEQPPSAGAKPSDDAAPARAAPARPAPVAAPARAAPAVVPAAAGAVGASPAEGVAQEKEEKVPTDPNETSLATAEASISSIGQASSVGLFDAPLPESPPVVVASSTQSGLPPGGEIGDHDYLGWKISVSDNTDEMGSEEAAAAQDAADDARGVGVIKLSYQADTNKPIIDGNLAPKPVPLGERAALAPLTEALRNARKRRQEQQRQGLVRPLALQVGMLSSIVGSTSSSRPGSQRASVSRSRDSTLKSVQQPPPQVVHRHHHHHYHHHYRLDGELAALVPTLSAEQQQALQRPPAHAGVAQPAPSPGPSSAEGPQCDHRHIHYHTHCREEVVPLRAQRLLEEARVAAAEGRPLGISTCFRARPKKGHGQGASGPQCGNGILSPDTRLPRLA